MDPHDQQPPPPRSTDGRSRWVVAAVLALVTLPIALYMLNGLAGALLLHGEARERERGRQEQCSMRCGLAEDECLGGCSADAGCYAHCSGLTRRCREGCR